MIYNLFNVYKSKYDKTSLEKFIFKLNSRTPPSLFFRQILCSLRNSSINIYFHMYFFSRINTNWKILKTLVPIVKWDVYKIPFKQSSSSHGKFEFINSVTHPSEHPPPPRKNSGRGRRSHVHCNILLNICYPIHEIDKKKFISNENCD